jgi:hypothetical protein
MTREEYIARPAIVPRGDGARTIQNSGKLIEQCAAELKQDLDARVAAILKALQSAASA